MKITSKLGRTKVKKYANFITIKTVGDKSCR